MHSLNVSSFKVVIAERFTFQGGTVEQVKALFRSSQVLLCTLAELLELPDSPLVREDELPPAQTYCP
jgi:hypothetical protein